MKTKLVIAALLIPALLLAQSSLSFSDSNWLYGIGTKLNLEFGMASKPAFKLGLTAGAGYNVHNDDFGMTPTIHGGLLIFNSLPVGADQSKPWYRLQSHFFLNGTMTLQLDKLDFNPLLRPVPLYHFAEFTANPLQNPYKSSTSYGVNFIRVQGGHCQRTGFFNLNVLGRVQLSYYNDGGPVLGWAGDNRDRYYTGGLVLSYHGDYNEDINLVELSYHKYTGYQRYAFDVGEHLQIDFINYHDTNQFAFNQQRWRLNISNLNNGFGGSVSLYNKNRLDLQDFLHFNTNVPYHPDYAIRYRWMFGARYEYNDSKFGL